MSPRIRKPGFIPIEPDRTTKWTCTIAGTDITDFILAGNFPHGLISEELICEIELDNSGEDFTNAFSARDTIQFKMDFSTGSTIQFEGEVEEIKAKIEGGFFKLGIKGGHFTAQCLDVMVTAEFTGAQISVIKKNIIADHLPDFTTNNVEDNTDTIDIKFVNKPLLDCLLELDRQGDEDTYIDFDKDFHSFKKSSKTNLNIHFTDETGSLISLRGLGTDSAEVRNKITVYGEAGGLPVIAVSEDTSSETTFRTKEKVITDNTIVDEDIAQTIGNAEKTLFKDPLNQGSAISLFWTGVNPGDKAYVISDPQKIHSLFRIVKFVFRVPEETMEVFFNQERSIPKLFKDRIKKDLAQETIVNKNQMTNSFNFGSETGFNQNKIDGSASNDIEVIDGNLKMKGTVETANMISITKNTPITVDSIEVRVIGESLSGTSYYINADGTNNWQQVSLNENTEVTNKGTRLRLRTAITSTTTRISSAVILYK